ncbi:MFS transporter [Thermococcus pacificus]|uniref:Quinolone resistance protein n=1 Tax=Thermococcus pacificus TaxID=71998 RepID=A0A218P5B1_9EURY|nr:MFS transporter [Thermococcus pacificus]ASJ05984.1 quinolone resistance protein [Thermococcus pacificus]
MDRTVRNIWLLNLSTFFFFLGISSVNPIVSPFSMTLGASPFLVGTLAGITSVVSLISKPVGGLVGDRGYRLEAMILGNLLSLVSGVLYVVSALTGSIWLFAFTRALHGFSMGIFFPSSLSTAVDLAPVGRVGETLGWRGMMFSLGNIIGPALGGYASDYLGFAGAFFLVVIFSAVGALFVVPVRRDVGRTLVPVEKSEEADYSELLRPYFVAASVALLFFAASYSGVTTFLPALYKELSYPQRVFGTYMMVIGIASFVTRLIGGRSADRMGPIPVSAAGLLTVITGYMLLIRFTTPPASYASAVLIGAGFGLAIPAMQLMALGNLPQRIRTMGSSVYTMFFDLGTMGGQFALGYAAGGLGYAGILRFLPALAGVALLILAVSYFVGDKNG